nr:sulfotransferase domain-containing protein [Salinibacter ruber]
MIGCPVEGHWGRPDHDDSAIEGQERTSEYRCYKSHHSLEELDRASEKSIHSVLYIVRDPRQIIVSGSYFFDPARSEWVDQYLVERVLGRIPGAENLYKSVFRSRSYRKRRVLEALLYGDSRLTWADLPWAVHVEQYTETDHLIVRYEDLLEEPKRQCVRILDHVGLKRSGEHIESSIHRQSMDVKKRALIESGNKEKTRVMRKGSKKEWKENLTMGQVKEVEKEAEIIMSKMGYETTVV